MEHEIASYREESAKQRKIIFQLEKEREKYINETSELNGKLGNQMEDLKIKKMELFESQKKIMESEGKINLFFLRPSLNDIQSKNTDNYQAKLWKILISLKNQHKTRNFFEPREKLTINVCQTEIVFGICFRNQF